MTTPEPKIVTASIAPITLESLERGADDVTYHARLFRDMMEQQKRVNETVAAKQGLNWIAEAYSYRWDFLFAGVVELVELAKSREDWWKWWTHGPADHMNVKIELVDAFHFFLSYDIANEIPINPVSENVVDRCLNDLASDYARMVQGVKDLGTSEPENKLGVRLLKEVVCRATNIDPYFNASAFFYLCKVCNLDIPTFYKIYIGKACLNRFRQKHGYKEGTYHKMWWFQKEDNHYLMEWLNEYKEDVIGEDLEREVMQWLETSYQSFLGTLETGVT